MGQQGAAEQQQQRVILSRSPGDENRERKPGQSECRITNHVTLYGRNHVLHIQTGQEEQMKDGQEEEYNGI